MSESSGRSTDYRYSVGIDSAELTPLAQIEVYFGPLTFQVLNVSKGGMALLLESDAKFKAGDIIDASVGIRERAFPVQLEIKSIQGFRVSSAFVNASDLFLGALKEFLQPKTLGFTLHKNEYLSGFEDLKRIVPEASSIEVYQGNNLSFFAAWLGPERQLLFLLGIVGDLVVSWSPKTLLRTGRTLEPLESSHQLLDWLLSAEPKDAGLEIPHFGWDRQPEVSVQNYFVDILLSWINTEEGRHLVEKLLAEKEALGDKAILFPHLKSKL